jgi:ectoine hydroxylase-related dioxygenase (phytanoyl-CoA dioxygenase family)
LTQVSLDSNSVDAFHANGFVIVRGVIDDDTIAAARSCFEPLFSGLFDTGLQPDEWNWRTGSGADDVTRQICNAWKSDARIASIVTRGDIGRACAELRGWPGARLNQDNVIWKPPGARSLGFHQDDSYQDWIVPGEMMTFWITLDDTSADQGTIEYVRGSHRWPLSPPIERFHAPGDPLADMLKAARAAGVAEPELVPIEVKAGSAVIHHGRTWHGSRDNRGTAPRRSVVAHCMSSAARFHPKRLSPIYSRYKRRGTDEMDESFFPVLWRRDGYRTPWLDAEDGVAAAAPSGGLP